MLIIRCALQGLGGVRHTDGNGMQDDVVEAGARECRVGGWVHFRGQEGGGVFLARCLLSTRLQTEMDLGCLARQEQPNELRPYLGARVPACMLESTVDCRELRHKKDSFLIHPPPTMIMK